MVDLYVKINDIEKMQYKRKPKRSLSLEFDLSYITIDVSDPELRDRLQKNPLELIVMDRQTSEMVAHDFWSLEKKPETCQIIFWEVMRALPNRIVKIYVSNEMKHMLLPLERLLGIELVKSELPTIMEYRDFVKGKPLFDE